MSQTVSSDAFSIIGFFLTLVGLLGSFFYIHLGDWYRDVLSLVTKWEIYRTGDNEAQKMARNECRYEIEQVGSFTTFGTSIGVTAFIVLVSILSLLLWQTNPQKSDAWNYLAIAGISFLVVYFALTLFFLIQGYRKTAKLRRDITTHSQFKPKNKP
jgi:hypothetical protein